MERRKSSINGRETEGDDVVINAHVTFGSFQFSGLWALLEKVGGNGRQGLIVGSETEGDEVVKLRT